METAKDLVNLVGDVQEHANTSNEHFQGFRGTLILGKRKKDEQEPLLLTAGEQTSNPSSEVQQPPASSMVTPQQAPVPPAAQDATPFGETTNLESPLQPAQPQTAAVEAATPMDIAAEAATPMDVPATDATLMAVVPRAMVTATAAATPQSIPKSAIKNCGQNLYNKLVGAKISAKKIKICGHGGNHNSAKKAMWNFLPARQKEILERIECSAVNEAEAALKDFPDAFVVPQAHLPAGLQVASGLIAQADAMDQDDDVEIMP
mmetsp:Transcript_14880/g.48756  ORF Transcript_14880/g.48756 Transcript_14880/m.48756 type:complete len:262 (-) Transcript_14880:150-935(-)